MSDAREPEVRTLSLVQAGKLAPWAALCGSADLFCTPRWLAVEQAAVGPWVPTAARCLTVPAPASGAAPVAAVDGERLLAGITVQRFDRSVDDDTVRLDKMLAPGAGTSARELAGVLQPSLMCGGWFNSRVLTAPGMPERQRRPARRSLIRAAISTARSWDCPAVFLPYVDAADRGLRCDLRAAGFTEFPAPARHVFDCGFPGHAAYVETLPSRRKVRLRKELRRFAEAGVVTAHSPLDGSNVERIAALAHGLEQKYEQVSSQEQLTQWFAAIAVNTDATVFTAALGGRPFAMSMWLRHEERLYGFHAGFDYEVGVGLPGYAVVGYHLPIAYACDEPGLTTMEYGISADEAKLLRGTEAMPQVLAVKPLTGPAERALAACAPAEPDGDRLP
ncbi:MULTISPECIES: GNAT family N-acetyltransferase [unclassified Streptomyces]|uniref:GNAT family N-acetyltransferase n=1 Tax=unclassified Streptomyces TaxID=2593676 RepID=UPI002E3763C0|nr:MULTISPECIES: GNAT family N-acetyltransferase [unclassified Streptomyces]